MLFLRVAIFILLAICLWNPVIPLGKGSIDFFVLIDDSKSMQNKLNSELWRSVSQAISELPNDSRVAIIRYAKQPVMELPLTDINSAVVENIVQASLPPQNKQLDRSVTNLEKALDFIGRLIQTERPSILLIIHDGQQTVGNADKQLQKISKRIQHVLQLDLSSFEKPDVWIESLDLPVYAKPYQLIPVSVVLGGNQDTTAELDLFVNEKRVLQQTIELSRDEKASVQFTIPACIDTPVCQVKVVLNVDNDNDSVNDNNIRQAIVSINILKPVLFVSNTSRPAVLLDSLRLKNKVEAISADLCIPSASQLGHYRVVILDDIAINNMTGMCWDAVDKAVRKYGVGLVVLGGDNSFSRGAYRHSLLESILPVTAEAAKQDQVTTLLFLVDKSGSMDNDSSGHSRIKLARQAIIETLKSANSKDNIGVISFDVKPQLIIPIQNYLNAAKQVEQKFNPQPAGGTRLKPALDFAISELEKNNTKKRILILLTDGHLDKLDLQKTAEIILEKKLTIIIMAIGQNEKTNSLKSIAELTNGSFLKVDNVAELPRLMRKEMDQRRTPIEVGEVSIQQVQEFPFISNQLNWPRLSAYNVTKEKQEQSVFLKSQKGDPLWAMHHAGIGKVIAIPGGFDRWAGSWINWEKWNIMVNGLVDSASLNSHHPFVDIRWNIKQDKQLQLEAITSGQQWLNDSAAWVKVLDPYQQLKHYVLANIAPGQYVIGLKMDAKGVYKIAVKVGEYDSFFYFYNDAIEESLPSVSNGIYKVAWAVNEDTLPSMIKQRNKKNKVAVRGMVLALILLLYLLLIVLEKYPAIRLLLIVLEKYPAIRLLLLVKKQ